jgi:hypothetical protein
MRRAYFFSPFGKGRSKGGLILQPLIYSSKFKDLNGFVEASIGIEPIFTDLQGVFSIGWGVKAYLDKSRTHWEPVKPAGGLCPR